MARGEFDLIAAIAERLPSPGPRVRVGSGDDAAVVEPGEGATAVTVDAIIEGVHFTRPEFPPEAIGRKALASALSDLAAMGAAPGEAYVVLGAQPEAGDDILLGIADGIAEVAGREGVSVAGGDLVAAPELLLAVTGVGYEAGAPLVRRAGAGPGEVIVVTGELGGAAAALELLTGAARGEGISPERRAALVARQFDPHPRLAAGRALAEAGATSMIDLSDGLGADAGHLAAAGGRRIEIDLDRLPLAEGVTEVARRGGAVELAALGGEDLELLATLPEERLQDARTAIGAEGLELTEIGYVADGEGVSLRLPGGGELEPVGFDHRRGSRSGSAGSGSGSADSGSGSAGSGSAGSG
jgi:thiamine-monophosphate kinase